MIVVHCANGVVLWQVRRQTLSLGILHCLNDAFEITYNVSPDATHVTALGSLVSHSVSLRGAFLAIAQIQI